MERWRGREVKKKSYEHGDTVLYIFLVDEGQQALG